MGRVWNVVGVGVVSTFDVDVEVERSSHTLGVEHRWEIPEGMIVSSIGGDGTSPKVVVTVTQMDDCSTELRDELVGALREIHETLSSAYGHADAPYEPQALHALNLATEALSWVDDPTDLRAIAVTEDDE